MTTADELLTVIALSTVYGLIELAIWRHYYPGPPDADYPEPGSVLEARQQDLDYFRQFLELDRSYTSVTRLAAEALLAGMEPGLEDLSDAGFQLGIARAVAGRITAIPTSGWAAFPASTAGSRYDSTGLPTVSAWSARRSPRSPRAPRWRAPVAGPSHNRHPGLSMPPAGSQPAVFMR